VSAHLGVIWSEAKSPIATQFNGESNVEVVSDWTDAMSIEAPHLSASGSTPMGAGVRLAPVKLGEQKARYCNRPWLFLITDGQPSVVFVRAQKGSDRTQ
jgi:uncharacterized protein YegL